ncbi:MAG: hypothetical protein VW576_01230 [Opitutae bacterium]
MRPFILFCILVQFGCDYNPSGPSNDWNGTDAEFLDSFKLVDGQESNDSFLLVEKNSGEPFTGEVSRNKQDRVTTQSFSGGLLNGQSIKTSPDGSWVEANYVNGQLHGDMIFFDSDGKIRSVMSYREGKRVISQPD